MIKSERITFLARKTAPNPQETTYWIDLTTDPSGKSIKAFDGTNWVPISAGGSTEDAITEDELAAELSQYVQSSTLNNYLSKAEATDNYASKSSINDMETKTNAAATYQPKGNYATKATSLSGYGITDAYTITQTNSAIDTKVAALVNQAPETLDTLDELAAALGDDPNFATTVSNQIGLKANTADVYSKSDIDGKGFATTTQLNTKVSGTGVTNMQVVTKLPSSPDANTLYIVTAA